MSAATAVNLRAKLWDFWLAPADATPLAALRIGTAVVGLAQVAMLWPALLTLYGNFGLVQWRVVDVTRLGHVPGLSDIALLLHRFDIPSGSVVYGAFTLYAVALLALAVGFKPRTSAAVALLTHVATNNSAALSLYGVDTLIHVALFYLALVPSAGRWSVDLWRAAAPRPPSRVGLRALQVHLCLVYLNAGVSKTQGEQWWSGEALWRALRSPQFEQVDLSVLAQWPWVLAAGCWGTLAIECGYAFAIWVPRLRRPWLVATLLLHLGIALLMGLWLFSLMMAVLNVACFWISAEPRAQPVVPAGTFRAPFVCSSNVHAGTTFRGTD